MIYLSSWPGARFLQSLGLQSLGVARLAGGAGRTGSGRIAAGAFLPACPWTSGFVWPSLWLRVSAACPGLPGGAGWPEHTSAPGDCRYPGRHGRTLSQGGNGLERALGGEEGRESCGLCAVGSRVTVGTAYSALLNAGHCASVLIRY